MEYLLSHIGLSEMSADELLVSFVPNLFSAFITIFLVIIFYIITARIFEATLRKTTMQESLIQISVRSLYRGVVIIVGLILVLSKLGINVTAAVAGIGVLGIAVGFAAQQTIANIFSGFGIFVDRLYSAGDWVRVADHYGEVVSISLRTTKIRTLDNTYISVPNSLVTSSPVTNYSEEGTLRITAHVHIPYDESVEIAREALLESIKKVKGVLKKPEPTVVVNKLGEHGVELLVRIWVDKPGFEQKYFFLLTETCKEALDGAGITIPYPHHNIHIVKEGKLRKAKKK
ncbi:MAG: mechanosensitive ion channel family protein [Candidatus Pacebacteria bacterium]|nr:mechanosensitive ion channel family protein [Candidatus Paceibacterota bacterium]MBP9843270.1 mechanosensitive ion channel family protein [Candidatus Paceibacterota bacterium]